MKSINDIELELKNLELEGRKVNLEISKINLEREKSQIGESGKYLKKDLIECARRNIELLVQLKHSQILSVSEVKEKLEGYLAVMENVVELNK